MSPLRPLNYSYSVSGAGVVGNPNGRILRMAETTVLRDGVRLLPDFYACLGQVERDLLRVATAVSAVDRLSPRFEPGERAISREVRWVRRLDVSISVENPIIWSGVARELAALLGFMTDDVWNIGFEQAEELLGQQKPLFEEVGLEDAEVCLFSGGLDSAAGMLARNREGLRRFVAVSVFGNSVRSAVQSEALKVLRTLGVDVRWVKISSRLDLSGPRTVEELSQRSRGFFFLAVGAAVSRAIGARALFTYESGVGALNLPLGASQVGAQLSKAMHPGTLLRLEGILKRIEAPVPLEIPFLLRTKGEVCSAAGIGIEQVAASTVSCDEGEGHKREWLEHCGLCTSCLFRRVALSAAIGRSDPTVYRDVETTRHGRFELEMFKAHASDLLEQADTFEGLLGLEADVRWAARYLAQHGGVAAEEEIAAVFQRYAREVRNFLGSRPPTLVRRSPRNSGKEIESALFPPAW